ncbi:MAG: DGQHR domain-containing protein [Nitrospirota bacterium]
MRLNEMHKQFCVKAIEIYQHEKKIYLFSIPAKDLLEMAYFNQREYDRETGIQRPFKELRSREIAEYLETESSTLSNNIIINLESGNVAFKDGELSIAAIAGSAFVIDGQHRLRAFTSDKSDSPLSDFPLIVSAFTDLSLSEIAEIFVKINYYQKPVSKSLAYDLLGIIKNDIKFLEFYEAHEVTKGLNDLSISPWFGLIKMLGIGKGIITQAAIITALERNKILEDVLADYSIDDKTHILINYFEAIRLLFPKKWGNRDFFVSKTVPLNAYLRLFPDIFNYTIKAREKFIVEDIHNIIKPWKHFDTDEVRGLGGIGGANKLANILKEKLPELNK